MRIFEYDENIFRVKNANFFFFLIKSIFHSKTVNKFVNLFGEKRKTQ